MVLALSSNRSEPEHHADIPELMDAGWFGVKNGEDAVPAHIAAQAEPCSTTSLVPEEDCTARPADSEALQQACDADLRCADEASLQVRPSSVSMLQ